MGWFADAVEHHQGLLHGSRRDVLQDEQRQLRIRAVSLGHPGVIVNNRALLVGGGTAVAEDQDNWSFRFRVHRDFYP